MSSSSPSLHSVSPSSSTATTSSSSSSDASPQSRRHPSATSPSANTHQPRLSSPRIFRDIFSTTSSAPRTLPPARFQETAQDVTGAIAGASRAVQNAQHALQLPPITVDLTESSPSQSPEAHFLSHTTHPHGPTRPPRRSVNVPNVLDERVFGHSIFPRPFFSFRSPSDMLRPGRPPPYMHARNHPMADTYDWSVPSYSTHARYDGSTQDEIRREESRAILRQQQARAMWDQNLRNRTRNQREPEQAKPHKPNVSTSTTASSPEIESVDLTHLGDNSTLADVLSTPNHPAPSSQHSSSDTATGRSALTSYKCPICMETPTDATSTICGHLFCHRCITDTLKWSEAQRTQDNMQNHKLDGVCPVCRKSMKRKERPGTGRTLIPLDIKLVRRKRKRDGDKGKERARNESEIVDLEKIETIRNRDREKSQEMWNDLTVFG